jgi:hypothetical protein
VRSGVGEVVWAEGESGTSEQVATSIVRSITQPRNTDGTAAGLVVSTCVLCRKLLRAFVGGGDRNASGPHLRDAG